MKTARKLLLARSRAVVVLKLDGAKLSQKLEA